MMSEWISVKNKLHEKGDYNDYLITDGKNCYVGCYLYVQGLDINVWMSSMGRSLNDINITHWMPLPELPKEK